MEKARDALKKELDQVSKQEQEAKAALKKDKFAAMKKDQEANRRSNEDIVEMTQPVGSNGTAAQAELMRASGSMSGARVFWQARPVRATASKVKPSPP